MQIKKITLYNVPYTEDDHHQPMFSIPSKYNPIKTFDNISARNINFGNEIDLTATYDEIKNANYGEFIVELEREEITENVTYYAWIDSITTTSLIEGGNTHLTYHWDYWRTFKQQIKALRGTVVNRSPSSIDPPQYVSSIRDSYKEIEHEIRYQYNLVAWVFLVVVANAGNTGLKRFAFPINRQNYSLPISIIDEQGNIRKCAPFKEVIDGTLFTLMDIPKDKVIGISIGSISPVKYEVPEADDVLKINYHPEYSNYDVGTYDIVSRDGYRGDGWILTPDDKGNFNIFNNKIDKNIELLKWWCFPKEEVSFNKQHATYTETITLKPSKVSYFPILQRLKFYSTEWPHFTEIIFNGEEKPFYGEYNWVHDGTRIQTYTQIFNVNTNRKIVKIIRRNINNNERFDIEFDKGLPEYNKGMDNILCLYDKNKEFITITLNKPNESNYFTQIIKKDDKEYAILNNISGVWPEISTVMKRELQSTPFNKLILTDNCGYPINCFQQNHILSRYKTQCITQNNQMYVLISFNSDYGFIDNNEFSINLTPIDVTQEYFNEYVVSLERDAANSRRTENIIASLTDMAGTAAIGTMLAGPGGGILGAGGSLAKTILGGALTTGVLGSILGDYHQQELENRMKKLGSMLIRSGGDYSWTKIGYNISLVSTKIDDYSKSEYIAHTGEYGITCDEIDLTGYYINQLLNEKGPLKLSSITLDIGIPNAANIYIRNKLLNGVYLDPEL